MALAGGCLMMTGIASAAFVVQPVGSTQSVESWAGAWAAWDGIGLTLEDCDILRTGQPVPDRWPGHSKGANVNFQSADTEQLPTVTFDLGDVYSLTGMHFWNGSQTEITFWGVRTADVSVSTNGIDWTDVTLGGLDTDGTFFEATEYYSYDNIGKHYTFAADARYVRIHVTSNRGGRCTTISEVRFVASAKVIPPPTLTAPHFADPATFAFALTGETNRTYSIEASTDLSSWSEVLQLTTTATVTPVSIPVTPGKPQQFFRAFILP